MARKAVESEGEVEWEVLEEHTTVAVADALDDGYQVVIFDEDDETPIAMVLPWDEWQALVEAVAWAGETVGLYHTDV